MGFKMFAELVPRFAAVWDYVGDDNGIGTWLVVNANSDGLDAQLDTKKAEGGLLQGSIP